MAFVGKAQYSSFDSALTAANGKESELVLLKDATYSNYIAVTGKLTLDLNGNKLSVTGQNSNVSVWVKENQTLTIKDGAGSGELTSAHLFTVYSEGILNVYGGKISNTNVYYNGYGNADGEAVRIFNSGIGYVYGGIIESRGIGFNNLGKAHILGGSFKVVAGDYYSDAGIANGGNLFIEGDVVTDGFYCSNDNDPPQAPENMLPLFVTVKDGCTFTIQNSLVIYENEERGYLVKLSGNILFSYNGNVKEVKIPATENDGGYNSGDTWPRPVGKCVYWTVDR